MKKYRQERLSELIAEEISIILRTKMPDNQYVSTTVTGAKISRDMKLAHIFVSFFDNDPESREKHMNALNQASRFIRGEISRRLPLRFTPEIRFIYDEAVERGHRIINEIESLKFESHNPDGNLPIA